MNKKNKSCTGCRASTAKIYLYHSTKIDKARSHSVEWQTDSSVQKQWFMIQDDLMNSRESRVTSYANIYDPESPKKFYPVD